MNLQILKSIASASEIIKRLSVLFQQRLCIALKATSFTTRDLLANGEASQYSQLLSFIIKIAESRIAQINPWRPDVPYATSRCRCKFQKHLSLDINFVSCKKAKRIHLIFANRLVCAKVSVEKSVF